MNDIDDSTFTTSIAAPRQHKHDSSRSYNYIWKSTWWFDAALIKYYRIILTIQKLIAFLSIHQFHGSALKWISFVYALIHSFLHVTIEQSVIVPFLFCQNVLYSRCVEVIYIFTITNHVRFWANQYILRFVWAFLEWFSMYYV